MSTTEDIIMELVAMEEEIAFYEKGIEDAFTEIDEDMQTWNIKRQEAVKCELKKCLISLRTLDLVCLI
jgi:hypothetical protein